MLREIQNRIIIKNSEHKSHKPSDNTENCAFTVFITYMHAYEASEY